MTTTPRSPAPCSKKSTRGISSSVLIGSPYHKKSNAEAQRFDGVRGDTLQAFANRRKDDWDTWLPYAIFAIKNAASMLGGELTPFFINPGQRLRLPLSLPAQRARGAARRNGVATVPRASIHDPLLPLSSPTCWPPENHRRPARFG